VLYTNQSFEILSSEDIEKVIVAKQDLGFGDLTAFAVCEAKNELWLSDKKGFAHIVDLATLNSIDAGKELKTIYGHPGLSMASSHNGGAFIALSDTKGYTTVFEAESRE